MALRRERSWASSNSPTSRRPVAAFWDSRTPKTIKPPPLSAIAATSSGKSVCGRPFAGGSSDLPIQIVRLRHAGSHRGVKELVGQRPRPDTEGALECREVHASNIGMIYDCTFNIGIAR